MFQSVFEIPDLPIQQKFSDNFFSPELTGTSGDMTPKHKANIPIVLQQ
jgi:hypothetical protein